MTSVINIKKTKKDFTEVLRLFFCFFHSSVFFRDSHCHKYQDYTKFLWQKFFISHFSRLRIYTTPFPFAQLQNSKKSFNYKSKHWSFTLTHALFKPFYQNFTHFTSRTKGHSHFQNSRPTKFVNAISFVDQFICDKSYLLTKCRLLYSSVQIDLDRWSYGSNGRHRKKKNSLHSSIRPFRVGRGPVICRNSEPFRTVQCRWEAFRPIQCRSEPFVAISAVQCQSVPFSAVQSHSKPFKAVQGRLEPFRAIQSPRTEPFRAVQGRTEPFRTVHSRSEPFRSVQIYETFIKTFRSVSLNWVFTSRSMARQSIRWSICFYFPIHQ